jgi:hypothetical protein
MKRVWVVDDTIPVHIVYVGAPYPRTLDARLVQYLIENVQPEDWNEPAVLELCRALCSADYEATFFTSPGDMLRALEGGAVPPHAVIFDWEYPGSSDAVCCAALEKLLTGSFVYVQIYTHLGHEGIEPRISDLLERFPARLLPPKAKGDVRAQDLAGQIRAAWEGTIAGPLADRVRQETVRAIESSLIDLCSVGKSALSALAEGTGENLVHLVLSKIREQLGEQGFEVLEEISRADRSAESSIELRRLMSVWYYSFPTDDKVRRGDLIDIDGALGFVMTPPCDLVKFPKKAGRRLTWIRLTKLDATGLKSIVDAGLKFDGIGNSIIASQGRAGEALILLPNVPDTLDSREKVSDYALLCHAWENSLLTGAQDGLMTYEYFGQAKRRCTLAEPFLSAVVAKVTAVISSPGTPC